MNSHSQSSKEIWALAEARAGKISSVSYEMIARAKGLQEKLKNSTVVSVLLHSGIEEGDLSSLLAYGADRVLSLQHSRLEGLLIEDHTAILEGEIKKRQPHIILAGATTYGRSVLPYTAAKFYAGLTADCTILDIDPETEELIQTRPAIGGNILATIKTPHARPQMATIRPNSTPLLERKEIGASGSGTVETRIEEILLPDNLFRSKVEFIGFTRHEERGPSLEEAVKIVSGGRGLKKAENFQFIHSLAEQLNAGVGASREAVDRGWISYPHQVGLSGKTVNPELYFAVGISGSIQHLAGMQTAAHIIAVDENPEAQIFQVADLGIQGDLFALLPALSKALERAGYPAAGAGRDSGNKKDEARQNVSGKQPDNIASSSDKEEPRPGCPSFAPVTPEDAEVLRSICGRGAVLYDDPEKMEQYAHDEVNEASYHHLPEVVVKPQNAEEISKILSYANKRNISVTPRGAGSGLSGGAVPQYGGILLSVEVMNRIIDIDTENMTITVEPGVVTNEINQVLEEHSLFYAGYPMSLETCFIAGNIAENAGGGKAIKYGVTDRYVLGLEAVLPTGEIVTFGGKRVKDVTGYDIIHLLTGSEGTLAIFTKAILKLLPLPKEQTDLLVLFPDTATAIKTVPRIMIESGVIPTAIEYMDRLSVQTTCKYLNETLNYQHAGAMLLITIDGNTKQQVDREYESIGELCKKLGAFEVYVADNLTTRERIWKIRKNIAEAFKVDSPVQSIEDIVVPFASIPELMEEIEKLSALYNVRIPCYGHAGDGNMHATPVKPPEMDMDTWYKTIKELLPELYTKTIAMGGTISGEHGIGNKRSQYLAQALSADEIALMKRIKTAFDPKGILNPGKIWLD